MGLLTPNTPPLMGRLPSPSEIRAKEAAEAQRRRMLGLAIAALAAVSVTVAMLFALNVATPDPAEFAGVHAKTVQVPPKRDFPANTDERDLAKWVPIRMSSGRTELEPFTTVDDEWLADPNILNQVMGRKNDPRVPDGPEHWPIVPLDAEDG